MLLWFMCMHIILERTPPYEINSEIGLLACLICHPYMAESHLSENQDYIKHINGPLSVNQNNECAIQVRIFYSRSVSISIVHIVMV